jgi:hypothetical protein
LSISKGYEDRWQLPHCLGTLDGKHVGIRAPANCGSTYYNYKGFHSIVLLALVDSNYQFLYINVGKSGISSDGGVFSECTLRKAVEDNEIGIPTPTPLPHDTEPLPYFLVADEAFPLRTWLMKPYPRRGLSFHQRIYNYRISRARRVVENAFGILVHRYYSKFQ